MSAGLAHRDVGVTRLQPRRGAIGRLGRMDASRSRAPGRFRHETPAPQGGRRIARHGSAGGGSEARVSPVGTAPQKEAKLKHFPKLGLLLILTAGIASAQNLTGTVTNGTTNKPAGGDDVILIKLANGMEEAARTKSDAKGNFSFKVPDDGGPHLVRVVHQGVTYHKMAPPGTTSVQAQVYDSAKKVDGIS